jgi:DNA-binding transcriptional MerR regulator
MSDMMHPRQVAERYNMTPESLANWRREGKGPPFIRLGNGRRPRVMYRLDDILQWEKEHKR